MNSLRPTFRQTYRPSSALLLLPAYQTPLPVIAHMSTVMLNTRPSVSLHLLQSSWSSQLVGFAEGGSPAVDAEGCSSSASGGVESDFGSRGIDPVGSCRLAGGVSDRSPG